MRLFVCCIPLGAQADRSLRKDPSRVVTRVKCDIKDFEPGRLPVLIGEPLVREEEKEGEEKGKQGPAPRPWLAVGKHLCGPATDFTLRCCIRHLEAPGSGKGSCGCIGLAVATCCHHRCTWKQYVNKGFFREHGFTPEAMAPSLEDPIPASSLPPSTNLSPLLPPSSSFPSAFFCSFASPSLFLPSCSLTQVTQSPSHLLSMGYF